MASLKTLLAINGVKIRSLKTSLNESTVDYFKYLTEHRAQMIEQEKLQLNPSLTEKQSDSNGKRHASLPYSVTRKTCSGVTDSLTRFKPTAQPIKTRILHFCKIMQKTRTHFVCVCDIRSLLKSKWLLGASRRRQSTKTSNPNKCRSVLSKRKTSMFVMVGRVRHCAFPNTSTSSSHWRAEAIRSAVVKHFQYAGEQFSISISIGIAELNAQRTESLIFPSRTTAYI